MWNNGIFNVLNPSFIRFADLYVLEDIYIHYAQNRHIIHLDMSDFGPGDLQVYTTGGYVIVEGKQEAFNDKSSVQHQFCRRIFMPEDQKILSLQCKYLPNGVLVIAVTMERIQKDQEEAQEDQDTTSRSSTLFSSEGEAQESESSSSAQVKFTKIQSTLQRFIMSEQLGGLKVLGPVGRLDEESTDQRRGGGIKPPTVGTQSAEHSEKSNDYQDTTAQDGQPTSDLEPDVQAEVKSFDKREEKACQTDVDTERLKSKSEKSTNTLEDFTQRPPEYLYLFNSLEECLRHDKMQDPAEAVKIWAELQAIAEEVEREELIEPIGLWAMCNATCLNGLLKILEKIKNKM
ncbi:jg14947 [Pararge aegeria aegeria]|uniref:Jg14947 protein n=1 Tax=Pararge aegeria aegeria TaxID=348720 RepID=A0A8S4SJC6_9NEOP|nr:jg14947 [Pararge aegeria aegeria]